MAPILLGAASVLGCAKRALDSHDAGMVSADAGGGGGANGSGGSASGGGTSGAQGSAGAGGVAGFGGFAGGPIEKKVRGAPCASAVECASAFCIDGVCCGSGCSNPCLTCAAPGSVGTCVNRPPGDSPRVAAACPVEIALTCGNDGTCDGAGACRRRPIFTVCGAGTCDGDAVVGQMVCDGQGNCRPGSTVICVPYRCDPATAACKSGCASDADCTNGYCEISGRCHTGGGGPPCRSNDDCASGFCVGGICCNTACDGPCQACNVRNWEGVCMPRPEGCSSGADAGSD